MDISASLVHMSAVEKAGLTTLSEGQVVEYNLVEDRSRTQAENLKVLATPKRWEFTRYNATNGLQSRRLDDQQRLTEDQSHRFVRSTQPVRQHAHDLERKGRLPGYEE